MIQPGMYFKHLGNDKSYVKRLLDKTDNFDNFDKTNNIDKTDNKDIKTK